MATGHLRPFQASYGLAHRHQARSPIALYRSRITTCMPAHRLARFDQPVALNRPLISENCPTLLASAAFASKRHVQKQLHIARSTGSIAVPMDDGNTAGAMAPDIGGFAKLIANIRATLFFAWSFALAIPLFITMMVMAPFVAALDKYKRLAQHFVNNIWAKASTSLFYSVKIRGREHLPPSNKAVVYVANHQSFLDIYSLFHLNRPFKFISKTSNFMIPIVGWSMFLTGHVMLNRIDRKSQLECLKQCRELLQQGAPVLFFPEGTRAKDCRLAGFKKGAFSVAVKAGVDVVPITLVGTGSLMPSGSEGQLRSGGVEIVVHPPIPTKGRNADQVCDEARAAVASALPPELVGSSTFMLPDVE